MKNFKLFYRIATGLLTAFTLFAVGMYLFNHDDIALAFQSLGYPTYIIYPLAFAKVLGLIALWGNFSKTLKEWAYAGFFFDYVLAILAHVMIGDGDQMGAIVSMVLLSASYYFWKKS